MLHTNGWHNERIIRLRNLIYRFVIAAILISGIDCPTSVFLPTRNVSQHIPPAEGSGLLVCEGMPSDSYLQQLLTYADSVSNWISAEIVICDSVKVRGDISHESNRVTWGESHYCHSPGFDFSSDTDSRVSHSHSPYVLPVPPPSHGWVVCRQLGTRTYRCYTWNSSLLNVILEAEFVPHKKLRKSKYRTHFYWLARPEN